MYIVFKGSLKHFHDLKNGKKVMIKEFKAGEVIGDPKSFNIYTKSVLIASRNAEILKIPLKKEPTVEISLDVTNIEYD
jgi:CRP-like cAMP-binding protein